MREFTLVSPTGEIVSGDNVTIFCKQYNLDRNYVYRVLNGVYESYKGWRLPTNLKPEKFKVFEFVPPVTENPVEAADKLSPFRVLLVNDSVPANVAMVPEVGKITFVTPALVNVVLKLPDVVKLFAVTMLPPKVIVLFPLLIPVPPYVPVIA